MGAVGGEMGGWGQPILNLGPRMAPGLMEPEESGPRLIQVPRMARWDVDGFYRGPSASWN